MTLKQRHFKILQYCSIIFLIAGCSHNIQSATSAIRPLQMHFQSSQCQILKPGISLIETRKQWQDYINKKPKSFGPQPSEPSLDTQQLLIISAGQKPSGGYQLRLSDLQGKVQQGEMTLPVTLMKPSGMTTSVITTPCMMLLVNTKGVSKVHAANMTSSIR